MFERVSDVCRRMELYRNEKKPFGMFYHDDDDVSSLAAGVANSLNFN